MNRKSDDFPTGRRGVVWQVLALVTLSPVIMVLVGVAAAQEKEKAPPVVNAKAAKLKNPLKSDAKTIDCGRELYLTHCASCHGNKGKGDGGGALGGGIPSDLTDNVWDCGSTDGEIFWVIREGIDSSADMLPYKKNLSDKEMWQIVVFIRSIGPKKMK
jgi:mono/diheme cytochrome c family protein